MLCSKQNDIYKYCASWRHPYVIRAALTRVMTSHTRNAQLRHSRWLWTYCAEWGLVLNALPWWCTMWCILERQVSSTFNLRNKFFVIKLKDIHLQRNSTLKSNNVKEMLLCQKSRKTPLKWKWVSKNNRAISKQTDINNTALHDVIHTSSELH